MKQRILVAAASLVLSALILLLLPVSPPEPDVGTTPTAPNYTTDPSGESNVTLPPYAGGMVRLYCCDEALLPALTELAAEFAGLTGAKVTVLTAEEDGCQATVQRLMESEEAPTVLCVHSQSQLRSWEASLLDLEGTALADALYSRDFGLEAGGKLLGIPMEVEGFGLLMNAELLGTKGALSRTDIYDLTSLATAVQMLKNNSVKAFPTASFAVDDASCLLLGGDLESARRFIDLYKANCSASGVPLELFGTGKSAFYLGGSRDYEALEGFSNSAFHVRNLNILPTFAAGAMQYVCSSAWCVNANAAQEDLDTTLAFLTWMVTADAQNPAPVDALQTLAPFRDAAYYGNQLEKKLRTYMQTEGAVLQWKAADLTASRLQLTLSVYLEAGTEANWDAVLAAVAMFKAENGYDSEK